MQDEMIEQFAVQELYLDGFEHVVSNGMMMATGYRIISSCRGGSHRVAVVRLVIKVENALDAMADAKEALRIPLVVTEADRIGRH